MDVTPPPENQGSAYGSASPPPNVFDTFEGLNTAASRPGIEDAQMSWCDGFMPIGRNNLRTLPGVGPKIFAITDGRTIVWYDFGNISTTPYMVVLLSDGSLTAINTVTKIGTVMGGPGTIQNPNIATIGMSQWGSQYLVIVAQQTNGLFIWNGNTLSTAGTLGPDVTLTNDGFDYTSIPTVTAYGGTGTGATFLASINGGGVVSVSVTNPGSGYSNNDAVALAFSGGGNPNSSAQGVATVSGGSVTAVSITEVGNGYTSTTSITFQGGGGFGATAVPTPPPSGGIAGVSVTNGGQGYTSPPTPIFSDVNNTLPVGTVDLMPFGVEGTACETYQSRLWIANGAQIQLTAPESLTDFSPADGGDTFTSNDSFLRVGFQRLVNTNGFLYLIADSSVNYISGVNTGGSPPITTFTNQNADPEIGTPYEATVDVFSSNIVFANAFGVHVNYGGRVVKVSEPLDGIYNTVPNFNNYTPSSAKAIIFGKRVWMLLIPVIDPITNTLMNKLFMWNGKIWWSSQQDVPLVYIRSQEINSVLTAYGTDGTSIYPLFQQPSTGFTKTVQSKLWDKPGGYQYGKAATRIWGAAFYYSDLSPTIDVTVDNETGGMSQAINLSPQIIQWVNEFGAVVSWTNQFAATVQWGSSGLGVVVFPPTAVAQQGVLTGLTISTDAADVALISVTLQDEIVQYRG